MTTKADAKRMLAEQMLNELSRPVQRTEGTGDGRTAGPGTDLLDFLRAGLEDGTLKMGDE